MLLFSIHNKQTNTFNPPFVARDVPDAQEMVRKVIIGGRDVSLIAELENLELYLVGSFDARDAELVNDLEHIVSLSDIPLPEHVSRVIDAYKNLRLVNPEDEKQWKEEIENCSSQ